MKHDFQFPKGFVWGVATAAPQIEGAAFGDGKGESVCDRFSRIPGKVNDGDTLDVACDQYHRYRGDFELMRRLGIRNYRLSLSWSRIYPAGDGALNQKGIDFYQWLVDAALAKEIVPRVTLFHWDPRPAPALRCTRLLHGTASRHPLWSTSQRVFSLVVHG